MVAYSSNFGNDFPSAETLKINYYWVASGEWCWTLFWSRARSTVEHHAGKIDQCLELSKTVGLSNPYLEPGSLLPYDHFGYEVAIQMVLQPRAPGMYPSSYQQWDTIRKNRSCFSNQVRASSVANATASSISDLDGKNYQQIGKDSCFSDS